MKISLDEIRAFNKRYKTTGDIAPDGVEKLIEKIGAQLGGIDEVIDFGKKYQGIFVVKIIECIPHPNADKLTLCLIEDGGFVTEIERNKDGLIQIVCGAPNVREGMLAVWLPPGSTVPAGVDKDPLILEERDIRGEISNGMLASSKELGFSDDHSVIFEVNEPVQVGMPFDEMYGLDDYIIDIENKMFTHRPDLFGFLGVARELAGIQQMPFKSPDWYLKPELPTLEAEELPLKVHNEIPKLIPRFIAVTMRNIKVAPSPLWLQIFLAKMGQKSINNIVDYTNFFMQETGQPLHAYDYDKVKALSNDDATIIVRHPQKDEKIKLLNGKEIVPHEKAIMIATDKELIGVGGVMGGIATEVDENTKNIILECATFDMYSIRRTAMEHGLFTDAVTRFTKGQSPLQNMAVIVKIVDEIRKYANGKVASDIVDISSHQSLVANHQTEVVPSFINARLGLELTGKEIAKLLENVEFSITGGTELETNDSTLAIKAPFWRTDIELPEDIVEEVGRLHGYDRLPLDLPKRSIMPVRPDSILRLKQNLREILASFGANETLTYSFIHEDLLKKAGQNKEEAYTISNALSPDLQYYRLSLTPSLLSHVHQNVKAGHEKFAFFELGKTHGKKQEDEDEVPKEIDTLALVITETDKNISKSQGSPLYQARAYLDQLAQKLGLELVYYPVERDPQLPMTAPFNLKRSAFVTVKDSKGMLGIVGEYSEVVRKNLKLPVFSSGFEIGVKELLLQTQISTAPRYKPLNRYPGTWQDICIQVSANTNYKDIYQVVNDVLADVALDSYITPIDIYQSGSKEYKNVTLRVHLTNRSSTITAEETKKVTEKISGIASEHLSAKII